MEKANVYYTDFRTKLGEGLPTKLKRLIRAAGIGEIDMDNKFVAIKMHFGELGNLGFLRPNYAKAVADVVKELGGKPFLTDCNTLYVGSRKNALEHLYCAWENGFTPMTVGCPILIGDGLKGTDDVEVPVNGEYVQNAKIGRAIMDADVFISLNHFKGHEMAGFGGAIKNIGMGCGSRAGKKEQHHNGQPSVHQDKCVGCKSCMKECANQGLAFDETTRKMHIVTENCVGCMPKQWWTAVPTSTSLSLWTSAPTVTATPRTTPPSSPTSACSPPLIPWPWTRPVWTPAWPAIPCPTASSATTWPSRISVTTTITSKIAPPTLSTRPAWSTPRRSASALAAMNWYF